MAESDFALDPKVLYADTSFDNECSDSFVWGNWYAWIRIAAFAVFIVWYIFIVPVLVFVARHRNPNARKILKWYTFVPAVGFESIWLLLAIIGDTFLNCLRIDDLRYLRIYAAANVFRYIASIILLGIVILPVTIALRKQAGYDTRLVNVVHSIVLALVAVFGIVQVTMWDYNNIVPFTGGKRIERKAADALSATYSMLYFVAALAGGVNIVTSCLAMRRKDIPKSSLFIFAFALVGALIAGALVDIIVVFAYRVVDRNYAMVSSATFGVLSLSFQAGVFGLVCLVAQSRAFDAERVRSVEYSDRSALRGPRPKFSV